MARHTRANYWVPSHLAPSLTSGILTRFNGSIRLQAKATAAAFWSKQTVRGRWTSKDENLALIASETGNIVPESIGRLCCRARVRTGFMVQKLESRLVEGGEEIRARLGGQGGYVHNWQTWAYCVM